VLKKVSCRVVRSVPLSKSSGASRYEGNKHYKSGDAVGGISKAPYRVWEAGANVRAGQRSDSISYTGRVERARVSNDDGPLGQILDCYV